MKNLSQISESDEFRLKVEEVIGKLRLSQQERLAEKEIRDYHNMGVRIEPGDSIYSTTKRAKDSTYIKKDRKDNFREVLFEKYVLKAHLDDEGDVLYEFVFGIEYGCSMKYQEYIETFENTKAQINLEELLISKEGKALKEFCKQPRFPKEMREHLGNLTHISFDKRILKPLVEAGRLKLIRGTERYDWRYYWEE